MARLVGGEAGALLARCGLAEIAERVRCAPPMIYPLCRELCSVLSLPAFLIPGCHHLALALQWNTPVAPWGVWGPLFPVLQRPHLACR